MEELRVIEQVATGTSESQQLNIKFNEKLPQDGQKGEDNEVLDQMISKLPHAPGF